MDSVVEGDMGEWWFESTPWDFIERKIMNNPEIREKLCMDCQWFKESSVITCSRCRHPSDRRYSVIDGYGYCYCSHNRLSTGNCKEEGLHWEAKPIIVNDPPIKKKSMFDRIWDALNVEGIR